MLQSRKWLLRKHVFSTLQHQLSEGPEHFVRIVSPASASSAGVPDSDQNNLRVLRAFAVRFFPQPPAALKTPRTPSKFTGSGAWLRHASIPQKFAKLIARRA
jgi:hypothetical protein